MEKYDVKFKKKFGQNFLKDINIVKKIVATGGITGKSLVIEVGPGGAIMTRELSGVADHVLAYEIDNDLSEELYKRLENCDNVDILFQDFLIVFKKSKFSSKCNFSFTECCSIWIIYWNINSF